MHDPVIPAPSARVSYEIAMLYASEDVERAKTYGRAARSPRTRTEYARDWNHFARYCAKLTVEALPAKPQAVAAYLASLGELLAVATIRRRAAAIAYMHRESGHLSPTGHVVVERVLAGIARTHGTAPYRKAALTTETLRTILTAIDSGSLRFIRDRALLLLGFSAALRRSELVALDVADLTFEPRGVTVHIRNSKTDQEGHGEDIAIVRNPDERFCAVHALQFWLDAAGITSGPVFQSFSLPRGRGVGFRLTSRRLSGRDVARIVKQAVRIAELEGDYSGHSLRAGFITSAAVRGIADARIQRVSRHRSLSVLHGYIRHATRFDDSPLLDILAPSR